MLFALRAQAERHHHHHHHQHLQQGIAALSVKQYLCPGIADIDAAAISYQKHPKSHSRQSKRDGCRLTDAIMVEGHCSISR
jgi:hypothetical protein